MNDPMIDWKLSLSILSITSASLVLSSCASQCLYIPSGASATKTTQEQKDTAFYSIPSESPKGAVQIMSAGTVKLKSEQGGDKIPALHLRMIVSNQTSDTPCNWESIAQTVSFPNAGSPVTPIYVISDSKEVKSVSIRKGEVRSLDLYFPLPKKLTRASEIPGFDFHWKLKIVEHEIEETTTFDRVPLKERDSHPNYGFGLGIGIGL